MNIFEIKFYIGNQTVFGISPSTADKIYDYRYFKYLQKNIVIFEKVTIVDTFKHTINDKIYNVMILSNNDKLIYKECMYVLLNDDLIEKYTIFMPIVL